MQRSVKFSAKLNNLIAGISDRITHNTQTRADKEREREKEGEKERERKRERGKEAVKCDPQGGK